MLDRVLLDTNALLNAAFITESWSAIVVSKLAGRRSCLFVGSQSLVEATKIAWRFAIELRKKSDPTVLIEALIHRVGAIEVPPAADSVESEIPAHDRHVVQEAITANATIFTSDGNLWTGCRAVGRPVLHPLQALRLLDGLSLGTTVFGVAPGRYKGSVFARLYPGEWGGMKNVGDFTVADFFGRLRLAYSTAKGAWIAELAEVGTVTVAMPTAREVMQVVAISWDVRKAFQLRVAGVSVPGQRPMPKPLSAPLVGNVSIGHRADGTDSWNGAINVCVMNDRPLGKDLWGTIAASADLTPNPYDFDRLKQAINRVIE